MASNKKEPRYINNKFPSIMTWFRDNLVISSTHVRCNTSIREEYDFMGHNFMVNTGFVSDQHIHSDYEFLDPPDYKYLY